MAICICSNLLNPSQGIWYSQFSVSPAHQRTAGMCPVPAEGYLFLLQPPLANSIWYLQHRRGLEGNKASRSAPFEREECELDVGESCSLASLGLRVANYQVIVTCYNALWNAMSSILDSSKEQKEAGRKFITEGCLLARDLV